MTNLRLQITSQRFLSAVSGFLLWLLAAGSLTLWWLHMPKTDVEGVAVTQSSLGDMKPVSSQSSLERALGDAVHNGPVQNAPGRFKLLGVISSEKGAGSALIAVDGQPPRPFVVGQELSEGSAVKFIGKDKVVLTLPADASAEIQLNQAK